MISYLEKRNNLPIPLRDFIISDIPRYEIERVCFMYGLKEEEIRILSFPIALIFIKDLKLKDYPALIAEKLKQPEQTIYGIAFEINKRIFFQFTEYFTDSADLLEEWSRKKTPPLISEDEAWKKVLEIEPEIPEREQEKREMERKNVQQKEILQSVLEKIKLSDALKKYPEIGEQLITSHHIKLRNFPEPVRPSIKNWLSDYTYDSGYNSHNAIERGTFLFRNENARELNSADRERLAYILKAHDENIIITVNSNTKQILFPQRSVSSTPPKNIPRSSFPSSAPSRFPNNSIPQKNNLNFSSPQKMAFENQQPTKPMISKNPLPKNLVNLKEDF